MKVINKLKISIFCILFFLVGVAGSGVKTIPLTFSQMNETATEFNNLLAYENPNLGFSLEYPTDWSKEESLMFIAPPPSSNETLSLPNEAPESIAVTTEVLPYNMTLDEYSESAIGLLEGQFTNYTLIDSSEATLSGYPAHQITYTYTLDGVDLKNMQIWTIADNNIAYALTYGGFVEEFDSSFPVIENMINSFRLTEIQQ
jgi:hypothetical protein